MGAGLGLGDPQVDTMNGEGSEFHGLGLSSVSRLAENSCNSAVLTISTSRATSGNSCNLSTTTHHSSLRYTKVNFPPHHTHRLPPSQSSRPPTCILRNNNPSTIRRQTKSTPEHSEINCELKRWTRGMERALVEDTRLVMGVELRGLRRVLLRGRTVDLVL